MFVSEHFQLRQNRVVIIDIYCDRYEMTRGQMEEDGGQKITVTSKLRNSVCRVDKHLKPFYLGLNIVH